MNRRGLKDTHKSIQRMSYGVCGLLLMHVRSRRGVHVDKGNEEGGNNINRMVLHADADCII